MKSYISGPEEFLFCTKQKAAPDLKEAPLSCNSGVEQSKSGWTGCFLPSMRPPLPRKRKQKHDHFCWCVWGVLCLHRLCDLLLPSGTTQLVHVALLCFNPSEAYRRGGCSLVMVGMYVNSFGA